MQKELAAIPAMLSVERAPQVIVTGGRLSPIDERLQEDRRNLDTMLLKYTEDHPDVKAARKQIAQIEAEGAQAPAGAGQPGRATNGAATNPASTQIKLT